MKYDDVQIIVAGAAGQGLVTISSLLLKILSRAGYHLIATQDYMSRVRGGHNFMTIRVASRHIYSTADEANVLVALDQESVDRRLDSLVVPKIVIYDKSRTELPEGFDGVGLSIPLKEIAANAGSGRYENSVALGALLAVLGLSTKQLEELLAARFGEGSDVYEGNVKAAKKGSEVVKEKKDAKMTLAAPDKKRRMLISGAESIGAGMVAGGLRFIAAYPMSPSTAVFTYIIKTSKKSGVIYEQAEDEIAAINMALGASAAGARTAVTTSGGGLALMTEGISLAGIMETPVVVANLQRPGPATGLPTRTGQEDLDFVLSIGHGEFPRFVFAPFSVEEAFYTAMRAMGLAEKYQVPVFILGDQLLADTITTVTRLEPEPVTRHIAEEDETANGYRRYKITADGVSPRAFYGQMKTGFMVDSHMHDEYGHITEDAEITAQMVKKRFAKTFAMSQEFGGPELYGRDRGELLLVTWGSPYGAAREAADAMNESGTAASVLRFNRISPFPAREAIEKMKNFERCVVIENNYQGQFNRLLRRETGEITEPPVLRYDGRPFTVKYIIDSLRATSEKRAAHSME